MIYLSTPSSNDAPRYFTKERVASDDRYPSFISDNRFVNEPYSETKLPKENTFGNSIRSVKFEQNAYQERDYPTAVTYVSDYSEEFIQFKTESFIRDVLRNLKMWANEGTVDAIPQIANVKLLLQQHERYLVKNNETRLLLGGLELIFDNNTWESLPSDKVKRIYTIFSRFENRIEINDVKIFMSELHTQKISVMAENYEETQEKK